jgi:hypothetical protein
MPTDPPPQRTSPASPGQSVRRERLAQLYDEMGDTAKQELLQFAEDLSGLGFGARLAPSSVLGLSRSAFGRKSSRSGLRR